MIVSQGLCVIIECAQSSLNCFIRERNQQGPKHFLNLCRPCSFSLLLCSSLVLLCQGYLGYAIALRVEMTGKARLIVLDRIKDSKQQRYGISLLLLSETFAHEIRSSLVASFPAKTFN